MVARSQTLTSELLHLLQRVAENHIVTLEPEVSDKLLLLEHQGEPKFIIGPHLIERNFVPFKPLRPHFYKTEDGHTIVTFLYNLAKQKCHHLLFISFTLSCLNSKHPWIELLANMSFSPLLLLLSSPFFKFKVYVCSFSLLLHPADLGFTQAANITAGLRVCPPKRLCSFSFLCIPLRTRLFAFKYK